MNRLIPLLVSNNHLCITNKILVNVNVALDYKLDLKLLYSLSLSL